VPDFFITWGLWLVFSLLAAGVAVAVDGSSALESPSSLMVLVMLTMPWVGLAGWPILVSFWKGNGPVADFGLTARWSDVLWGVGYGLAALMAAAAVALATQAVFGEFDSAVGDLVAGFQGNVVLLLVFGLLVGIGAPVVEELAFRGLLFGALAKSGLAPWLTIGISGLLFSLMHFEPIRIPLLLSTGIVLGVARYHRRSTTVSIFAHMTNNIPAAVALVFMDSTGTMLGG
jgi:membrane protease YdiL (CAAX protease family)